VHLVDFTIEMYQDAWPYKRHTILLISKGGTQVTCAHPLQEIFDTNTDICNGPTIAI